MCNERESNVASDNASAEPLQASDDRRPLTTAVSEDQFHEAWRRAGEQYARRTLEDIEANIAGERQSVDDPHKVVKSGATPEPATLTL